jgi:hypothetical protein
MDMKQILQAMDSVKTSAPIENTDDMKRFMSIVTEGSNPHKVALPVQMAMQHYAAPSNDEIIKTRPASQSLLKQYMAEASAEQEAAIYSKKVDLRMYAQKIAYKVMENAIPGHSAGFTGGVVPGLEPQESVENPQDVIKLGIPLLMRLLEYAREDAQTDMDLHNVTEMLIKLSTEGNVLTMDNYDQIVSDQQSIGPPEDDR